MTHPERLGKYPITGVIGEGAMGVVYKAYDPGILRPVAIKTIHKKLIDEEPDGASFAARFRNEAQAVGRLMHPGIVVIYEFGEDGDTTYIAMEFVEGRNLSQILAATPMLREPDILRVMDQLLDALDVAHRHGVWHRDIKPANLIITPRGQLKVTDFGIARIESKALTQITSVIGTPGYMAPEQYNGGPVDHRVDVFAAGVILYRMLAARPPFAGSQEQVMFKILNEQPPPPSSVVPPDQARSPWFDAIVAKALAKKPEDRYQSAAEFRQALIQAAGVAANVGVAPIAAGSASAAPSPSASPSSMGTTIAPTHLPTSVVTGNPVAAGTKTTGGTLLSASSISGWDVTTLAPVEAALATVLGPVAKLMVRQAARTCADMASLTAKVAEQIADPKERNTFLAKVVGLRSTSATVATAAGPAVMTQPPVTQPIALPQAVIDHAVRVIAAHMGPIARIVVKKAAAQAQSVDHLHMMLAEQANEGPERVQLLTQLRKGS